MTEIESLTKRVKHLEESLQMVASATHYAEAVAQRCVADIRTMMEYMDQEGVITEYVEFRNQQQQIKNLQASTSVS